MAQSFVCLNYQLIFGTRGREPILSDALRPRLFEYVGGILRSERSTLLAAGGMLDHTHWLVSLHQGMAVAEAFADDQGEFFEVDSRAIPGLAGIRAAGGLWGLCRQLFRCGRGRKFIRGQAAHHRVTTYQEEFVAFLRRHDVAYDERYLWD